MTEYGASVVEIQSEQQRSYENNLRTTVNSPMHDSRYQNNRETSTTDAVVERQNVRATITFVGELYALRHYICLRLTSEKADVDNYPLLPQGK
jgi:hypothetical protein